MARLYKKTGLNKYIKRAEGLLDQVSYNIHLKGTVPIEPYRNRCLNLIEAVNKLTGIDPNQLSAAKERLFNVYFKLQEYDGPERSSDRSIPPNYDDVEVSIDSVTHLLDEAIVSSYQKNQHAGGLGFSTSRGMTLSEGMGQPVNQYWNKVSAAEKHPVRQGDPTTINYNSRETTQEWRDRMAAEKADILWREDSDLNRPPSNGENE